jgi:nickel-dependent lactate racemase
MLVDRWEDQIEISVPESASVVHAELRPEHPAVGNPDVAIRDALASPRGMPPLKELVDRNSKVAVAFDDPLKFGPKFITVPILLDELERAGVDRTNITLASGNGTHDIPPKEDFKGFYRDRYPVLPDDIVDEFWPDRFVNHDAHDPNNLVDMGTSSLGGVVEHNRILVDSDLLIYTGSVFPLIWGGHSGEGVVVGLGSARSIYSHHRFSVIGSEGSINGNPRTQEYRKHKDAVMDRIEEFIGRKVPQWQCADQQHLHKVPQADIIVIGLPKYIWYGDSRNPILNILAATTVMRSWRNKPILKKGGVVILVSKCDGHIDPEKHPSYERSLDLFAEAGSAEEFEKRHFDALYEDQELVERYRRQHAYHPVHPVWLFNENQYVFDHAGKVIVATGENPDAPGLVGAEHAPTFDDALSSAYETVGADAQILVLPNYFSFVPMVFDVE